jgi:hypothetical protein
MQLGTSITLDCGPGKGRKPIESLKNHGDESWLTKAAKAVGSMAAAKLPLRSALAGTRNRRTLRNAVALLVGQNELNKTLARDDMRQLKQRIGLRMSLGPLAPMQVGEYLRHRWLRAGGTELPF